MRWSVVTRGRVSDSRHVELAEPIDGIGEEVEVVIRSIPLDSGKDVFDVIVRLAAGSRVKADIDRQIRGERASWEDR